MPGPKVESAVLIGYGSFGRYHASLLHARYPKVAIVDSNENVYSRIREDYPEAVVGRSLAELDSLAWKWDTSMGVIVTWAPSHATLFEELLHLGVRHILCEKPLAHSVEAGAGMLRVAEEFGAVWSVHHQWRYLGFLEGLNLLARDLGIGDPCSVVLRGGAYGLVTNGIHYIDLASNIFGQGPEWVVGSVVGEPINPRSDQLMFYGGTAAWSFGDGREATMCASNRSRIIPSMSVYYRDALVEVLPNFDVDVRRRVDSEVHEYQAVTRTGIPTDVAFRGPVPGIRSEVEATAAMLDEIESGTVRVFPPTLALRTLSACIGALAAGRDRRAVQLPIDPLSVLGRTQWPIS